MIINVHFCLFDKLQLRPSLLFKRKDGLKCKGGVGQVDVTKCNEMAMIIRQNERFRSVLWVRVIKNKYFCKLKLSNNTYKNIHLHSCLSK